MGGSIKHLSPRFKHFMTPSSANLDGSGDVRFVEVALHMLRNYNQYYTDKANEYLKKLGVSGGIVVLGYSSKYLPQLQEMFGLACAVGVGGWGVIIVERELFENVPEGCREFIVAHETAHIARNHLIARVFINAMFKMIIEPSLREALKTRDFLGILLGVFSVAVTLGVDVEVVRGEELEADTIAINLTGCESAQCFARFLKILQEGGQRISHEAILGLPALTIEERLANISQYCRILNHKPLSKLLDRFSRTNKLT
jgi:Zn-dependent protease with chaperone function